MTPKAFNNTQILVIIDADTSLLYNKRVTATGRINGTHYM